MNNQKIIVQVNPVIDYKVRSLCVRPYYNHPKGCPNFNKKEGCPPRCGYYDDVYDLSKPVYAICNVFDLKDHIERMRAKQPGWSAHQLACCLYWQPRARKQLEAHITDFFTNTNRFEYHCERCPEAMGVDVISTLAAVGITIKFPPKDIVYQVALAAVRK